MKDKTELEPLAKQVREKENSMRDRPVRWVVLCFTCLFITSRYYNFDVPQGMQKPLQDDLNLSPLQYNLLYTGYAVPNIIWPLFAGQVIDKIGCRLSILIFVSLIFIGQSLFTIGCFAQSFILLLIGRVTLGIGGEAVVVIKVPIMARWFRPNEQGIATGIMFAACRTGSILQSTLTPLIYNHSQSTALAAAAGAILSIVSLSCGFVWIVLDRRAENYDKQNRIPTERELSLAWLRDSDHSHIEHSRLRKAVTPLIITLAINAGLTCGTIYTFLGNANKYLQERAAVSSETAGQYISLLYILSVIFSLVFGKLVDKVGRRAYGATAASGMTLISFVIFLMLPDCEGCVSYLIPMSLMGVGLDGFCEYHDQYLPISFSSNCWCGTETVL